ncbi:MAG TPA: Do family serine endopeptidase [Alphaproteobacteria bacterium]|nr:Do family serine endopeptidase [Alphaproteobacteria bacterium]
MAFLRFVRRGAGVAILSALAGAAAPVPGLAADAEAADPALDFSALAEAKLPAVVNVSAVRSTGPEDGHPGLPGLPPGSPLDDLLRDFFGDPDGEPQPRPTAALGSGFVIDANGYVVTNNHVVAEADDIQIILQDDTELAAELVGRDPRTDIALLRVDADEPLPALEWGDSDAAEVGDWVIAIGNPFGLGGSVTAGIVSARGRNIHAGPYDDFIQTDAAINQGNSGGPLFDTDGRVIGVTTAIFSPSGGSVGIGFAVPSSLARAVVEDMRDDGRVERGWLGIAVQPVTDDVAGALQLDEAKGVLVAKVTRDSPADDAGIEAGDVIVRFGDAEIADGRTLARAVAAAQAEQVVPLTVVRDGETTEVPVTIGLLEDEDLAASTGAAEGEPTADPVASLGMHVAAATAALRARFGIGEDVHGLVVTAVEPGSVAARQDLREGDIIVEAGRRTLSEPRALNDRIEEARQAGHNSILLLRRRADAAAFLALPVDPQTGRG